MRTIITIVNSLGTLSIISIQLFAFKGTILEYSFKKGKIDSFFLWLKVYWLTSNVIFISYIKNLECFFSFFKDSERIPAVISYYVTINLYLLILAIFIRLFNKKDLYDEGSYIKDLEKIKPTFKALAILSIISFITALVLGMKHAIIYSLITKKSLLSIRFYNSYFVPFSSYITMLFMYTGYSLMILSGYLYKEDKQSSLIGYALASFLLTFQGAKAPFVFGNILFFTFLHKRTLKMNVIHFLVILILIAAILSLFFILQIGENVRKNSQSGIVSIIFRNLMGRLGIGQMQGFFETFSILNDGSLQVSFNFISNAIPFGKKVFHELRYDKVLMLKVSGKNFSKVGVMNSYFVMEAMAIMGWLSIVIAPIIVGITNALGIIATYYILKFFIGESSAVLLYIPLSIIFVPIDLDFTSFIFMKGYIQLWIFIAVTGMVKNLLSKKRQVVIRK